MLSGLIGKKLGMTQVTEPTGTVRAATVIQLGPCAVTQIKTAATDGYDAVQISFGRRRVSRVTAAAKTNSSPGRISPPPTSSRRATWSTFRELPRDAATPASSGAITSPAFPARAARTNISVTAARSATAPIPAACARGCGWRGS